MFDNISVWFSNFHTKPEYRVNFLSDNGVWKPQFIAGGLITEQVYASSHIPDCCL